MSASPSYTGNDLCASALRLLGITEPTTPELTDALEVLNAMIDSWNTERPAIFTVTPSEFSLVAGTQAYTLGSGGVWNMERPIRIEQVTLKVLTNPTFPVDLPIKMISDAEWAAIPLKNLGQTYPGSVWDDGGFPLRTLSFWPIPTSSLDVVIYGWTALGQFTADDPSTFPAGYARALRYNLAVECGPEFGREASPTVMGIAMDAKAKIMSQNTSAPIMRADGAVQSRDSRPTSSMANFLAGGF